MGDERIARRAQDIHAGLREYEDTLVTTTVPVTTLIGRAATLAVHIRGLERITNIGAFCRTASVLGVAGGALPAVLRVLEDAGWLRVSPNVYSPKTIEENVPVFQSLYATLADQWEAFSPGELDRATIALVTALSAGPMPTAQACASLGIDSEAFDHIAAVGANGGYIRTYGKGLVYTPLFAEEHPDNLLRFIEKNDGKYPEIHAVLEAARAQPGIAVAELSKAHPVVVEMVDSAVISAPAVTSASGTHSFLFPPLREAADRTIIQKSRVLLACVKYGERYQALTRIGNPQVLLSRLRDAKMIGRTPHSHIRTQYQPIADLGLGFIEDHAGRYTFKLYDTEDNLAAVDLAIRQLDGITEAPAIRLIGESEVKAEFAAPERVVLPEENRGNARAAKRQFSGPQAESVRSTYASFMDDLRGIHRVR